MAKKEKKKFDKYTVPTDFTLSLALVDALPVIFFGASAVLLGMLFQSTLFVLGAVLCLLGGAGKVLWKILVVLIRKNVWPLFIQMRILMPAGFLLIILSLIAGHERLSFAAIAGGFTSFPSVIFFLIGILGMCLMGVFAVKLDSGDVRANWIEQLTNGIAQAAIFIGLLLLHYRLFIIRLL